MITILAKSSQEVATPGSNIGSVIPRRPRKIAISTQRDSLPLSARAAKSRFSQETNGLRPGEVADAVFYIQEGEVRPTVASKTSKEATPGILSEDVFEVTSGTI